MANGVTAADVSYYETANPGGLALYEAQVTQLARHRVARATAARAAAQARCASSGDDETTFSPSQPDFPEPPDPYIDAPEFFPAPPRFLEPPPIPPRCEVPPPDEDEDAPVR